jgi:hypothetical protein
MFIDRSADPGPRSSGAQCVRQSASKIINVSLLWSEEDLSELSFL